MTASTFETLGLKPALLYNLQQLGYTQMTEVQQQSLPLILNKQDVIAQAKTGSGKTCAFTLGVLQNLDVKKFRIQALLICPTRELADQVASEVRKLARTIHNIKVLTICGGMPLGPQIGSLEHGAHIIVGTPGRIQKHLDKKTLNLSNVNTLVLDEADRMLDMGFKEDIEAIIDHCPRDRQTLLFSATFPEKIESMSQHIMQKPQRVTVLDQQQQSTIQQFFYQIGDDSQREQALKQVLLHFLPDTAVVFCNTKRECQDISDFLKQSGFCTAALHGDLDQKDRDQTLIRFANHSLSVLIATDVAARGLDIAALDMVINYQLSRDEEVHVHRIGRTGRAGKTGIAVSLVSEREEFKRQKLEDALGMTLPVSGLPKANKVAPEDLKSPMVTIEIAGGKRDKMRPGDIVGALTADKTLSGDDIGKIKVMPTRAFVAVKKQDSQKALSLLTEGKIKGRSFRTRLVR